MIARRGFLVSLLSALAPLLALPGPDPCPAQEQEASAPGFSQEEADKAFSSFVEVTSKVEKLGPWENEYGRIERSLQNLWKENGWDDEADLYAKEVALEVSRIPPWEFTKRIETASRRLGERYQFSDTDTRRFQGIMMRETMSFLVRNAGVISKHASEMIDARSKNQPFSREQIARWTKESESLMSDVQERVARVSKEVRGSLSPAQQAIFDRDFASFNKRLSYFEEKRKGWAKGEWKPSDWGLQDDPIQTGAALPGGPAGPGGVPTEPNPDGGGVAAAVASRWIAHRPSTWIAYVREVESRYGFDQAQKNTAGAIHEELTQRANRYAAERKAELDAVPELERGVHVLYAPIRQLFEDLRVRVDAIPTKAQRDSARQ